MIYQARANKKLKNIRVYVILKHQEQQTSILTKIFMKLLNQDRRKDEEGSATETLR
jgi:hypothetical protein